MLSMYKQLQVLLALICTHIIHESLSKRQHKIHQQVYTRFLQATYMR